MPMVSTVDRMLLTGIECFSTHVESEIKKKVLDSMNKFIIIEYEM